MAREANAKVLWSLRGRDRDQYVADGGAATPVSRAPLQAARGGGGSSERLLKEMENKLTEKERQLEALESELADRERALWEGEALLKARQRLVGIDTSDVVVAVADQPAQGAASVDLAELEEEKQRLEQMRAELDERERAIKDVESALEERQAFLDASESKLFEKLQEQQERETQLEQLTEELALRERQLESREKGIG